MMNANDHEFFMEINMFADLTEEEFRMRLGYGGS
jgi:hypothetical protein